MSRSLKSEVFLKVLSKGLLLPSMETIHQEIKKVVIYVRFQTARTTGVGTTSYDNYSKKDRAKMV